MNIKECFEKRILRKIPINLEKVRSSVKIAELKLEEAKRLSSSKFFNSAILSAYTSMFHIARALLYKDGIQEKSHYAVYIYLSERYSNKISRKLFNSFNLLRDNRHEVLYGFEETVSKEEAENSILDCEEWMTEIKKLL